MALSDYYAQHGQGAGPWLEGWDQLSDWEKERVKQGIPEYQGPGQEEQALAQDWWNKLQEGPDTNIWQGLGEALGLAPGAVKKWGMNLIGSLGKGVDFSKEYGLSKEALDRQLGEAQRDIYKRQSARGLLDSSATAAGIGGAAGQYSSALADLMRWKAGAEESSRQFNMGALGNFINQGMNFADFLNTQYLQDIGLRGEAIKYLAGERYNENIHGLQAGAQWGWNPTTGMDIIPGLAEIYLSSQGMPGLNLGDWGGGGGTSAPGNTSPWGDMSTWYEDWDQALQGG